MTFSFQESRRELRGRSEEDRRCGPLRFFLARLGRDLGLCRSAAEKKERAFRALESGWLSDDVEFRFPATEFHGDVPATRRSAVKLAGRSSYRCRGWRPVCAPGSGATLFAAYSLFAWARTLYSRLAIEERT